MKSTETPHAVFISTHLDDVALSCSRCVQNNRAPTVVTVLAGAPDALVTNEWNSRTTGKDYAPDAIGVRLEEDAAAMRLLGAKAIWLGFLDKTYMSGERQDEEAIADELVAVLAAQKAETVFVPLGIVDSDHVTVGRACIKLVMRLDGPRFLFYTDQPYGTVSPKSVAARLSELHDLGVNLQEVPSVGPVDDGIRDVAFRCYATQYGPITDEFGPSYDASKEQYWQIS